MKRILITGKNSYVGNNLERWLNKYPEKYSIDKISLRDKAWKEHDFSGYDVLVHCAGIAHQRETKKNAHLYYKVNRDLAYEVAKKAKSEGVNQFIFLSSMSVYGLEEGVIDENTPLNPKTNYGKSKFEAEQLITPLGDGNFKIAILRPPMIYGKGCKGNYPKLAKLALKTPVFPKIQNKRSMIYIDNLSEFLRGLIDNRREGFFLPQNKEYVCTSNLVYHIAKSNYKKIHLTKTFNPLIKLFKIGIIQKVFGDLIYKMDLSDIGKDYHVLEFYQTIQATEKMEKSKK